MYNLFFMVSRLRGNDNSRHMWTCAGHDIGADEGVCRPRNPFGPLDNSLRLIVSGGAPNLLFLPLLPQFLQFFAEFLEAVFVFAAAGLINQSAEMVLGEFFFEPLYFFLEFFFFVHDATLG